MCSDDAPHAPLQRDWPLPAQMDCCHLPNDWDDWDEFEPGPMEDLLWDAFESDDEMVEPEPEYGDFWGELDEEEAI